MNRIIKLKEGRMNQKKVLCFMALSHAGEKTKVGRKRR
tara:strand:- start:1609 stop:1722 length:114 start_codon:yes stop_codon:yes gene_type:complete